MTFQFGNVCLVEVLKAASYPTAWLSITSMYLVSLHQDKFLISTPHKSTTLIWNLHRSTISEVANRRSALSPGFRTNFPTWVVPQIRRSQWFMTCFSNSFKAWFETSITKLLKYFSLFYGDIRKKSKYLLGNGKTECALLWNTAARSPSEWRESKFRNATWMWFVALRCVCTNSFRLFAHRHCSKGQRVVCHATGEVREDLMRTETRWNTEKRLPNRWKLIFLLHPSVLCHHSRDCGRDDWSVHRRVVLSSLIDRGECVYIWPGIHV